MRSTVPRVHKNKSVQRLISSLWGSGTAKFQVTWLLRIHGTKGCIDVAVLRGRPLTQVDAKPKFIYRTFSFFFLHQNSQSGRIKGKKVRCFKGRYPQSTIEGSIARKRTRLGRGVLRHQLAQVCASSCIMSCFHAPRWSFDTQSLLVHFLPKMGLRKSRYLKFRRARPQCVVLHTLVLVYSWLYHYGHQSPSTVCTFLTPESGPFDQHLYVHNF